MPGARTMWLAAVFASALVRSTVLLTDTVPAERGYGGGEGGGGEGGGGEGGEGEGGGGGARGGGGGSCGGGAGQAETTPTRLVRIMPKEQAVAPCSK